MSLNYHPNFFPSPKICSKQRKRKNVDNRKEKGYARQKEKKFFFDGKYDFVYLVFGIRHNILVLIKKIFCGFSGF